MRENFFLLSNFNVSFCLTLCPLESGCYQQGSYGNNGKDNRVPSAKSR